MILLAERNASEKDVRPGFDYNVYFSTNGMSSG